MSELMSLVYLKDTGSVLTYATRRSAPSEFEQIVTFTADAQKLIKENELKSIVGTELVNRYEWIPTDADFKKAEFTIEVNQLDVQFVKFDDRVIKDHTALYINKDGELKDTGSGSVSVIPMTSTTRNKISLQAPTGPTVRNVWLQIHNNSGEKVQTATGTFNANVAQSDIPIEELTSGDKYLALVAVAGFSHIVFKFTVP